MKKKLTLAAALAVVLTSPVALADTGSSASSILDMVLTPAGIGTAMTVLATLAGLAFGGKQWLTERRKLHVALGAYHAFHVVEDIAAENPERNRWDKAAEGLQVLDAWMVAQGWRPLKPA